MRKFLRNRTQRLQTPVRIEDVVLRIVCSKRLAGILRAFRRAGGTFFKSLAAARTKGLELFLEQLMIGGEILVDQQSTSQRNNRDQIRRSHLSVDIVLRGSHRAIDFVRFHGGAIEEQNNETTILKLIRRSRCRSGRVRWTFLLRRRADQQLRL